MSKLLKLRPNIPIAVTIGIIFCTAVIFVISNPFGYTEKPTEKDNEYVQLNMEAFRKIQMYYWRPLTDSELSWLFQSALGRMTRRFETLSSQDATGTAGMLESAIVKIDSDDGKRQLMLDTLKSVLNNLEPIGRNGLVPAESEVEFRQNVNNINTARNLYDALGLSDKATIREINDAYSQKIKDSHTEKELEQITYSHKVLSDQAHKDLYDQTSMEPTVFDKLLGNTLYVRISRHDTGD